MIHSAVRTRTIEAALALLLITAAPAGAQEALGTVGDDFDARVERFLDGLVTYAMEADRLPGVVVSVVHGDSLVLARGWGLARIRSGVPVDPERTLFRVGSISKTFTFTGVMQQVGEGRLDLDEDISAYLKGLEIEGTDRYGPLTMTHLMTHTPGFEDTYLGHLYTPRARAVSSETDPPLTDFLARYQPARVRPAGELVTYSNYGVQLAGKVLQDVSGEGFAAYMERHVLGPLGMDQSSFRDFPGEPAEGYLDPELAGNRAIAYHWSDGRYQAYKRFFMPQGAYPAGSLSATAVDMSRFMRAHLNGGAADSARILEPAITTRMHRVLFRNAEGMMGNAHGFWSDRIAGYRTLEHGGAVLGFHSNMVLVPELDLGIFVSTNGDDGGELVTRLPRMLVRIFFPNRSRIPEPDSTLAERAGDYAGSYLGTRRGYTTLDKLVGMQRNMAEVSIAESGHLLVTGLGNEPRYTPAGGDRFVNVETGRSVVFDVEEDRAGRFYTGTQAFERVGFWQTARAFILVLLLGLVVSAGVLVGFGRRQHQSMEQTALERWASGMIGVTAVCWLISIGALVTLLITGGGPEPTAIALGQFPDSLAVVALWGTLVSSVATGMSVLGLVPVWHHRSWGMGRVLRHTAVVAVMVTVALMLWQWNAIGVRITG